MSFVCKARQSVLPDPQDCDWPHCGCDEAASKVITALIEEGWTYPAEVNELKAVAELASRIDILWGTDDECDGMDDAEFNETLDKLRDVLRPYRQRRVAHSQIQSLSVDREAKS